MAEVDIYPVETNSSGVASSTPTAFETQQPGGSGALREVMVIGDPTTRGNIQGVDSGGNAKVSNRVQALAQTTGTITTSSSVVTATTDISNAGTVTVFIYGTYAGVNLTFECSPDGTNWVPITGQSMATQQLTTNGTTGVLTANSSIGYDIPVPGPAQFRVRSTAYTSGTANVVIAPAVNGFEIAPSVSLADGIVTGSLTGTTQTAVALLNGASVAQVVLSGTFSATLAFEIQDASGTWGNASAWPISQGSVSAGATSQISASSVGVWAIVASPYQAVRVRCSAYTSGTVVVSIKVSASPILPSTPQLYTNQNSDINSSTTSQAPLVGAYLYGNNGSTWDRLRSSTSFGLQQDLRGINGVTPLVGNGTSGTGAPRVTLASDSTGQVAIATRTTGGATTFTLNAAASTNGTNVKASAGTLYSLELFNNAAYDVFFKMYNLATTPTVGSSTIVKRYKVPAGGGLVVQYGDIGQAFSTGIAYATTKLAADADTTVLVAGDLFVNGSFV